LGELLSPPQVLELSSDLGGGKTTFVSGLARGLGSKDTVSSPTFTLNQVYSSRNGVKISHHDFYRLNEAGIMANELAESLPNDKTITVIEWGGVVKDVLPADRITIEFNPVANDSEERRIVFTYPESSAVLIRKLENRWVGLKP
jgi:tRNA threonylcarbamoyladenosine biosynthesis protein TsaE